MKLTTIALAAAFALSSTFALAYTNPHKHRTHHGTTYRGTVGMGGGEFGRGGGGWHAPLSYGGPNNRGGLVGGSDVGYL